MTDRPLEGGLPLAGVHNQINPLTKLLMIVLRVAIGWHLLYEGYTKIVATQSGEKPFSAEMYLRNSTGPLRFYFRGLIDDFHGLDMLDEEAVTTRWQAYVAEQASRYSLDDAEKGRIDEVLASLSANLKDYLAENSDKIENYRAEIQAFEDKEQRPLPGMGELPEGELLRPALPTLAWSEHKKTQKSLDKTRTELIGPVLGWTSDLQSSIQATVEKKLSTDPKRQDGPASRTSASEPAVTVEPIEWKPQLHLINMTTMWGLAIVGGLLVAGLFTRLASLGGAAFLCLFYLAMPPWPGLDPSPIAEGNYLFVNKNLIEIIALLMFATSSVGVWGGLDSIIRGMVTRPVLGVGKAEVLRIDEQR